MLTAVPILKSLDPLPAWKPWGLAESCIASAEKPANGWPPGMPRRLLPFRPKAPLGVEQDGTVVLNAGVACTKLIDDRRAELVNLIERSATEGKRGCAVEAGRAKR